MKLTYLDHSGFVLETERSVFIFDYYRGELPELPEAKPLFVFVSHSHGDHFNPDIFMLASYKTRYILSDDLRNERIPEEAAGSVTFIAPHESVWLDNKVWVGALKSNDLGVAFLIGTEGKSIYFAGDLNNWWWDGDEEDIELEKIYHQELGRIKGSTYDLAFIPLDPRLANSMKGIKDFMSMCDAKVIIPMHMGDHLEVQDEVACDPETESYRGKMLRIDRKGQVFNLESKIAITSCTLLLHTTPVV